jgi:hypothetical protein
LGRLNDWNFSVRSRRSRFDSLIAMYAFSFFLIFGVAF